MDPFAMARRDLAASDLGVDALYQFKQGGPPFPVRLIISAPEDNQGRLGFGSPGKATIRVEATIAAAAIAPGRPAKGDLLGVGHERGYRVETVEQDVRGASFILGLLRQD